MLMIMSLPVLFRDKTVSVFMTIDQSTPQHYFIILLFHYFIILFFYHFISRLPFGRLHFLG